MTRSQYEERRAQEDKRRFGTQGAASDVRVIDPASVDTKVLIEQMKDAKERSERRSQKLPVKER